MSREESGRRPLVGIICCNEFAERPVQTVATRFIEPLARLSKANPVLIPAVPEASDLWALADSLDGLLLTGSPSNVEPHRYGGMPSDTPHDHMRDEVALSLSSRMIDRGKPVFGICRGLQEINVLFGGSLRDLEGERHYAPVADDVSYEAVLEHRHSVQLSKGSRLGSAGLDRSISVTSAHRQGIDRLGAGLNVEALCDDGLIEAVSAEGAGAPVLAVQWHPEITARDCPVSRSFYHLLRDTVRGELSFT